MKVRNVYMLKSILSALLSILAVWTVAVAQTVETFSSIQVGGTVTAIIGTGDTYAVDANVSQGDRSRLSIYVEDGILHVKLKRDRSRNGLTKATVKITAPDYQSILAYADAKLLTQDTLTCSRLSIHAKEGAQVDMSLVSDTLEVVAALRGVIKLEGRGHHVNMTSTLHGRVAAKDFLVQNLKVTSSRGGQAAVNAIDKINASVEMGGIIDHYGAADLGSNGPLPGGVITAHHTETDK